MKLLLFSSAGGEWCRHHGVGSQLFGADDHNSSDLPIVERHQRPLYEEQSSNLVPALWSAGRLSAVPGGKTHFPVSYLQWIGCTVYKLKYFWWYTSQIIFIQVTTLFFYCLKCQRNASHNHLMTWNKISWCKILVRYKHNVLHVLYYSFNSRSLSFMPCCTQSAWQKICHKLFFKIIQPGELIRNEMQNISLKQCGSQIMYWAIKCKRSNNS